MRFTIVPLLLAASAQALPADGPAVEAQLQKRQDYAALLELASSAGISIPTDDPGLLFSLAPVAAQLASYLPTAPVLSALQTAAPSNFLSNIVHDPSYAASFESQFAAGSSPSWFLALPSSVKDYLHTYSGYGGIVTQVGNAESILSTAAASASATDATLDTSLSDTTDAAAATSQSASDTTAESSSTGGSASAIATASGSSTSTSASDGAASSTTSAPSSASNDDLSSTTSTGGAPQETAAIAAGVAAAAGILGLAIAL